MAVSSFNIHDLLLNQIGDILSESGCQPFSLVRELSEKIINLISTFEFGPVKSNDLEKSREAMRKCLYGSEEKNNFLKEQKEENAEKMPTMFECNLCDGKIFGRKQNLKRHIQSVHKRQKIYKCKYCGIAFLYNRDKQRHVFKKHQNGFVEKSNKITQYFGEK